jgi:hypothetical protein
VRSSCWWRGSIRAARAHAEVTARVCRGRGPLSNCALGGCCRCGEREQRWVASEWRWAAAGCSILHSGRSRHATAARLAQQQLL